MSSAIPNIFGNSLNISSVFLWNMSPAGATLNGSHLYLYFPNWHMNVVRYHDHSSSFRLWFLELVSIRDKHLTLVSFGNILLRVGVLWTAHVSAWLCLAGSKHNWLCHLALVLVWNGCTFLLFHPHLVVWWYQAAAATLVLPWMASVMHNLHTSGGLVWFSVCFVCNDNVPLKCPIQVNTSLNSLCNFCMISALVLLPV